jgi:hypothetical protein
MLNLIIITLANRLIEGQVMNAQYAEESYQLKRDNCALRKQIEDKDNPNIDRSMTQMNNNHNSSDFHVVYEELETLRETVNRLTTVGVFNMACLFFDNILLYIYRKIVIYNPLHMLK